MPSIPVYQVTDPAVFPNPNGVVDTDLGWLNMSAANLDNPGPGCTALFKIARHTEGAQQYVDLGVSTNSYATTNTSYLVVGVYYQPPAGPPDCAWKIVVQFPPSSTIGQNKESPLIQYANNCPDIGAPNGGWNTPGNAYTQVKPGSSHWLGKTRFYHKLSRWGIEMKIPVLNAIADDGIFFPTDGSAFKLYVAVVVRKTDGTYNPHLTWPPLSHMGGNNILCGMPHPDDPLNGWGLASFE